MWKFDSTKLKLPKNASLHASLYDKKIEPWQIYYELLGNTQQTVASNTWGLSLDEKSKGKFTINKNLVQVIGNNSSENYFPAFLLPYRDKDEFVMPYDHQRALKEIVFPNIEELYLIGWKGSEHEFNKELKNATKLKK